MKNTLKALLSVLMISIIVSACAIISFATDEEIPDGNLPGTEENLILPEDGIVLTEDSPYCSCCHTHEHPRNAVGKFFCLFCKISSLFKDMFSVSESTEIIHKYLLTDSVAPTCFTNGERNYTCAVCNQSATVTDAPLTHIPVSLAEGYDPTCTEEGITEGTKCSLCDTVLVPQQIIPALGHDEITDAAIPSTCTETGISEGKHCARCSAVIIAQRTTDPLGHDFADGATVSDLRIYKTGTNRTTADITCFRCSEAFNDFPVNAAVSAGGYSKLYHTLEGALKSETNTTLYLVSDYTLSENITVGNGITLVIPCFANDKGYEKRSDENYYSFYCPDNPSQTINIHSFRKLFVPADKTITIANSGTVLINAVTGLAGGGNPASYGVSGGYGEINLAGKIDVRSGGIIDCSGYVTDGGGEIILRSGARMFETYGILYWRGGSYAFAAKSKNIFPIDGYELNTARAKITLEYGSTLVGNCKMYANSQYYYCHFKILGNGDDFLYYLRNGANAEITVDQNLTTIIKVFGDAGFGIANINAGIMNLKTSSFQAYKIDGKMRFEFYNGTTTCNQKCMLMPGVEIVIGQGATLNIVNTGALIFCTAKDYKIGNTNYPGYYSFDSRYVGALYPAGRDDAKLYVVDGGTVNVQGAFLQKSTLAGMVYVDSKSSVNFTKNRSNDSITLKVATGAVSGASLLATVKAENYTVPYIKNDLP